MSKTHSKYLGSDNANTFAAADILFRQVPDEEEEEEDDNEADDEEDENDDGYSE